MRLNPIFVLLMLLSACATIPKFQRAEQDGYTVREVNGRKDHLEVTLHNILPGDNAHYRGLYLIRAVGEECLARGFPFFDGESLALGTYYGFCFTSNSRGTLGLAFEGFPKTGPLEKWALSDKSLKPESELRVGDQLLKANGRVIKDFVDLVEEIFLAYKRGDKSVKLEFSRDSQTHSTLERLVQMPGEEGRLMGPKDLADLRSRIP